MTAAVRLSASRLLMVVLTTIAVVGCQALLARTASAQTEGQAIVAAAQAIQSQSYPHQPFSSAQYVYCFGGGTTTEATVGGYDDYSDGSYHDCEEVGHVGFDCRGLALYAVYHGTDHAVTLPTSTAQTQYSDASSYGGSYISLSSVQPGDLVFFGYSSSEVEHVGIVVSGTGASAEIISAVSEKYGIETYTVHWFEGQFNWVRAVAIPGVGNTVGGGAVSEGSFVRISGDTAVYEIVGGAPLYVSSWAAFGGEQAVVELSQSEFDDLHLSQYPANGTAVYDGISGAGYVFAGGAPLYVANWATVGSPTPLRVDGYALSNYSNAEPLGHVRQYPANGTAVYDGATGAGYVFAGGAPLYVANWGTVGNPTPVRVDGGAALDHYAESGVVYSHVRQYPANGTAVFDGATGAGYVFAGGAPLYVSNWAAVGDPPLTVVDGGAALDHYASEGVEYSHVLPTPRGGTFINAKTASGEERGSYVIAGGAPLYVSSWARYGGEPPEVVEVDAWDLENIANPMAHLNAVPANGTVINARTSAGVETGAYVLAGGAPFYLSSWEIFGGEPSDLVEVDAWDLENIGNPAAHLNAVPSPGTVVEGLPSETFWVFQAGTRRHSAATTGATAVEDVGLDAFARVAPLAESGTSKSLSPVAESLNGTVNPEGEPVSECRFEYGTTSAYGSTASCAGSVGEGETPVAVSATVADLKPGTEYHYRLVAVGPGGTSESTSAAFTTAAFGITTASLPEGTVYTKTNKALYKATLAAIGGKPPYKWSLATGSELPPGLKLASSGKITGKASRAGSYTFTVQIVDTKTKTKPPTQNIATATLSIAINAA